MRLITPPVPISGRCHSIPTAASDLRRSPAYTPASCCNSDRRKNSGGSSLPGAEQQPPVDCFLPDIPALSPSDVKIQPPSKDRLSTASLSSVQPSHRRFSSSLGHLQPLLPVSILSLSLPSVRVGHLNVAMHANQPMSLYPWRSCCCQTMKQAFR